MNNKNAFVVSVNNWGIGEQGAGGGGGAGVCLRFALLLKEL